MRVVSPVGLPVASAACAVVPPQPWPALDDHGNGGYPVAQEVELTGSGFGSVQGAGDVEEYVGAAWQSITSDIGAWADASITISVPGLNPAATSVRVVSWRGKTSNAQDAAGAPL